jgi:hypothetical protein
MKIMSIIALSVSFLALGACGNNSNESDKGAGKAHGGDVALTKSGAPKRADGYWELRNIGGAATVMGSQFLCIGGDAEERRTVFDAIAMNNNCSKYDIKRSGSGWDFAFICGTDPMLAETSGKVSGNFTSNYKIEMQAKEGNFSQSRTIEATKGGPCPTGTSPGDLMDGQGKKIANTLN